MNTADPDHLQRVQLVRKAVLAACILSVCLLAAFSRTLKGAEGMHEAVETVGLALIGICVVGRAWCSLYIGGRKKAEIVDRGPYSVSRNPLYVFSFIGAFGVGAMSGSLTIGLVFALACWGVFRAVVEREERFLAGAFGATYERYRLRTPRFLPDLRLWRDEAELTVRPAFFLRTLRDGLVFLLALPLFELLEGLQQFGWFSVIFQLP